MTTTWLRSHRHRSRRRSWSVRQSSVDRWRTARRCAPGSPSTPCPNADESRARSLLSRYGSAKPTAGRTGSVAEPVAAANALRESMHFLSSGRSGDVTASTPTSPAALAQTRNRRPGNPVGRIILRQPRSTRLDRSAHPAAPELPHRIAGTIGTGARHGRERVEASVVRLHVHARCRFPERLLDRRGPPNDSALSGSSKPY